MLPLTLSTPLPNRLAKDDRVTSFNRDGGGGVWAGEVVDERETTQSVDPSSCASIQGDLMTHKNWTAPHHLNPTRTILPGQRTMRNTVSESH